MTSRIVELHRPSWFVDQQGAGPFRSFRHEHPLREENGITRMTDTVILASPLLGRMAERLILVSCLRKLIEKRNDHLLMLLEHDRRQSE